MWISPAQVLKEAAAGKWTMIFPTRLNVQLLADTPSVHDAQVHTKGREIVTVQPWFENDDGEAFLCIPPEAGYPISREAMGGQRG